MSKNNTFSRSTIPKGTRFFKDLKEGQHIYAFNNCSEFPEKHIFRIEKITVFEERFRIPLLMEVRICELNNIIKTFVILSANNDHSSIDSMHYFTTKKAYNAFVCPKIMVEIDKLNKLVIK